jgi:acetyl esterase/lipase
MAILSSILQCSETVNRPRPSRTLSASLLWVLILLASRSVLSAEDSLPPQQVPLWSGPAPTGPGTTDVVDTALTVMRSAHPNGSAIVICPGGGYGGLMMGPEGTLIAAWLNRHGIAGIVLPYRLPHGNHHVPLLDAQRAIRVTRSRATEWGIDPGRIGIMGFSAGGHLASTAATHFDAGDPAAADPVQQVGCRPDFAVLIYPVITMGEKTHGGSRKNLLGPNPAADLVEFYSGEKQVTDQTPPCFMAHALDDTAVTADNSRMFYEALRKHQVAAHYLELPSGGHGLNGYQGPMWDAWQTESIKWLAELKMTSKR